MLHRLPCRRTGGGGRAAVQGEGGTAHEKGERKEQLKLKDGSIKSSPSPLANNADIAAGDVFTGRACAKTLLLVLFEMAECLFYFMKSYTIFHLRRIKRVSYFANSPNSAQLFVIGKMEGPISKSTQNMKFSLTNPVDVHAPSLAG